MKLLGLTLLALTFVGCLDYKATGLVEGGAVWHGMVCNTVYGDSSFWIARCENDETLCMVTNAAGSGISCQFKASK